MADVTVRTVWALCCVECGSEQESDAPGPDPGWMARINILVKCRCLLARLHTHGQEVTLQDFDWQPTVRVTHG